MAVDTDLLDRRLEALRELAIEALDVLCNGPIPVCFDRELSHPLGGCPRCLAHRIDLLGHRFGGTERGLLFAHRRFRRCAHSAQQVILDLRDLSAEVGVAVLVRELLQVRRVSPGSGGVVPRAPG